MWHETRKPWSALRQAGSRSMAGLEQLHQPPILPFDIQLEYLKYVGNRYAAPPSSPAVTPTDSEV